MPVRVLFLVPPPHRRLLMEYDQATNDAMGTYIPIGLLSLATFVRRTFGARVTVAILDCTLGRWTGASFEEAVRRFSPDVVCMSVFTPLVLDVQRSLAAVRRLFPDAVVVVGGAHVTSFQETALSFPEIDYGVMGYGEYALGRLIAALFFDPSVRLADIPGLLYREGGRTLKNQVRNTVISLDDLPLPDLSLVDFARYRCPLGTRRTMVPVISSRGCPFHCTFCNSPDKTYAPRSIPRVFEEVEMIWRRGVREVFFFDDLFNLTNDRVWELCALLRRERLPIAWGFKSRVHNVTEEFVRTLKAAGCERIHFGIESHTDASLKALRKGIRVEQVERAVRLCDRYRINSVGSFMINLPGDTLADIHERFRFARRLRLDYAQFAVLIAYPFTAIFDEGVARGMWPGEVWHEYVRRPTEGFAAPIWDNGIPRATLYDLVTRGFRSFYFRPGYVWQRLRKLHSLDELLKTVGGAFALAE